MAKADLKELKKDGFIKQVQTDRASLRLRIIGGQIQAEQLQKVTEIAQKYGQGYVHMTARQSIEIPFIRIEDMETVKIELKEVGLEPGAYGPRVRTITACQGENICPSGLIDTTSLAKELDSRYFARELPHKFKLGVTGCRNNCLKAEENDLGIKGGVKPVWNKEKCNYCCLCQAVCPVNAIKILKDQQDLLLDEEKCNYCGKCIKVCHLHAWEGKKGFILSFGGLFGNRIAIGEKLLPIIYYKADLFTIIDKTLEFFKKYGKRNERFRDTLDRVGWELLINELEVYNVEQVS